jgi:tRNA A-37 threonylcarbamoyl transferase component Bud32
MEMLRMSDAAAPTPSLDARGQQVQLRDGETQPAAVTNRAEVTVPGYEILIELGRGGMGIVYKARHLALNRLVALKMIRTAGLADEQVLNRFRSEAAAVARLHHPGIVQIYDFGQVGHTPYFAMELVEGGNLAKHLAGTPLPSHTAAALVEQLARAVSHAHEQRIVHRDLKPANVLLGSFSREPAASAEPALAAGSQQHEVVPKISDFGLAKQLESDSGQTQAGQILGTPSYMAPEQAAGQGHAVGPAADIYALGAILYECLTGRPPFKGASVLETLEQVRGMEPVPPARLHPGLPRDMETICLKCLQKEPGRRYGSAAALAEDLRRFQAGEPILARPVGKLERGVKWVRRNPVLAGALATVLAALLLGAIFSTHYALQARATEGELATQNDVLQKETTALAETAEKLTAEKHKLEQTLVRSSLAPLGLHRTGEIAEPEWVALWDLARNRHPGRAGYLFVEYASQTPARSRQLRDRAALALHAAVGLDAACRHEVNALLMSRLADSTLSEEHKTDLAQAAAAWDGLSSAAARAGDRLARALVQPPTIDRPLWFVESDLQAAAAKMGPGDAAQTAGLLVQALKDNKNPSALSSLVKGFSALVARMKAREACALLTETMTQCKDARTLQELAQCLAAVTPRLEQEEGAQAGEKAVDVMMQAVKDSPNGNSLLPLIQGLLVLTPRMAPGKAAQAKVQAGAILIQAIEENKDPRVAQQLIDALWIIGGSMGPREAAQTASGLLRALADSRDPNVTVSLARALSGVAGNMEPGEGVVVLTKAMKDQANAAAQQQLAGGLAALAARTESPKAGPPAAQAAANLIRAVVDGTNGNQIYPLVQNLKTVINRLEPREATVTAAALIQAMKVPKFKHNPYWLEPALELVATRIEQNETATTAALLIQAMKDTTYLPGLPYLANGLSALAGRMDPEEAAQFAGQAVAILTRAMKEARDLIFHESLPQALVALAAYLKPSEVESIVAALAKAAEDSNDPPTQQRLGLALATLGTRMEPRQGGAILRQALKDARNQSALPILARGLAAVAVRMDRQDALQAAAVLTEVLKAAKDPLVLKQLVQCLSVVAGRVGTAEAEQMAAKAAGQAAVVLLQALNDPKTMVPADLLSTNLMAVLACMDRREAATLLTQTVKETNNAYLLAAFARMLPALAQDMERGEAEAVAGQIAARLVRIMREFTARNPHFGPHPLWAESLSAVLATAETRAGAALLMQAMSDSKQEIIRRWLLQGLAEPAARRQRCATIAAHILAGTGQSVISAPAFLPGLIEPLPSRLSTQQLVHLLKMPTCTANWRGLILSQLGQRYQRRFSDQWDFVQFAQEQHLDLDFSSPPSETLP